MPALCEDHHEIDFGSATASEAQGRSSSINWSRGGRPARLVGVEAHRQCMRLAYRYWQPGGTWREDAALVRDALKRR